MSATISQCFHWQCVLISQNSVIKKISCHWITIANSLTIWCFDACSIYGALTSNFWSISRTTPVMISDSISINPRREGREWVYSTSMLDRLSTVCWTLCQGLKWYFEIQMWFSNRTLIWSLEAEYSKLWMKQLASEHRWSSVGGKVYPSCNHWFGFNTVIPWISLNSHSTSKAWYSESGLILKLPFTRLPRSKYSWQDAAKVWVPLTFSLKSVKHGNLLRNQSATNLQQDDQFSL